MSKKTGKTIVVITIIALLVAMIVFFVLGSRREKEVPNKNSLGKELKKILEEPEVKKTWLAHEKKTKLERIRPDNEKTELTVRYQRTNSLLKGSDENYAIFGPTNCENAFEIAIARDHPQLQGKIKNIYESSFEEKRKFKLSFFNKDIQEIQENGKGRKKGKYFDKNNNKFQLETLPYQGENSQLLNPAFLGKGKIDLKKSIESGFAKITPEIRQRIEEQLSRDCYTNAIKYSKSLEIEIKEQNGLIQILGGSRYTIFGIKNLDDYTMACFTDYHPNHSFDILEDDALLTLFRLDKTKKKLTVYNPGIVQDVCTSAGLDHEKMLGGRSGTTNREYNRLKPYFQENSHIVATKIN